MTAGDLSVAFVYRPPGAAVAPNASVMDPIVIPVQWVRARPDVEQCLADDDAPEMASR